MEIDFSVAEKLVVPAMVPASGTTTKTVTPPCRVHRVQQHHGMAVAADGDVTTLTFTSNEPVVKLGTFKINGSNPDTFTNAGDVYTVTHLVDGGDQVTGAPVTFQINVKNAAGIYSQTVESTNDGSSVNIVR